MKIFWYELKLNSNTYNNLLKYFTTFSKIKYYFLCAQLSIQYHTIFTIKLDHYISKGKSSDIMTHSIEMIPVEGTIEANNEGRIALVQHFQLTDDLVPHCRLYF